MFVDVMRRCVIVAGLAAMLSMGTSWSSPAVGAEEAAVDLNKPEAMKATIEAHLGKRVKLKLLSGQDVEGKIAKVGTEAVVVTELAGMEFFDATVRIDQVAAVLVRVRSK